MIVTAQIAGASIDLSVVAGDWPNPDVLEELAARAVLASSDRLPEAALDAEISLLFTDDEEIAEINRRWRGKPRPTNVLSFPAASAGQAGIHALGDIVFGYETVAREAAQADLTLADHISHLLVHGLLHLLGYDHEDADEATAMETMEIEILARLGIADPYAGSEPEQIEVAGGNR